MWYVLNISSDMLLRSWPRMKRWVRIKKDGWREEGLQGTEEELLDRHARYAGTKEVCTKYMNIIKEDHPSIHEYIMDWGDSQFFYTHDQPHFSQDTNNPCLWMKVWMVECDWRPISRNPYVTPTVTTSSIALSFSLLHSQPEDWSVELSRSATRSQTPIRRSSTTQPHLVSVYLQCSSSSRSSSSGEGIQSVWNTSCRRWGRW